MRNLLIASLITLMSFSSSAGLVFTSNASGVNVGDTITLDVAFDFDSSTRLDEIYEFGLDLVFDPSLVSFAGAALADPYASIDDDFNGFNDYDLVVDDFSFVDALLVEVFNLDFTAPLLPTSGVVDLLSFEFTALSDGIADFALENLVLVDAFFGEELVDGSFGSSVQVSAPMSLSLLSLGLLALSMRASRKKA
ncbi:hypothetical protein [Agaribacter flavus]|uniref:PEP-CTERM protein-sorting domain-containing protein n=1 Tax=Agaribacter flavus TaxID=1902781 RepID=A0ABV7FM10_9ALTE